MTAQRYVLLDRDGTIIADRHYLKDPAGVELLPGAAAGLRALRELGLELILVSNQSGLGRGYFGDEDLWAVHQRLRLLLLAEGVKLAGSYYCPHTPEDACDCRKPAPGLAKEAADHHGFDPAQCFVIGDKRADVELGLGLGAVSILVLTGKGRQELALPGPPPHHVAEDLEEAARIIASLLAAGS